MDGYKGKIRKQEAFTGVDENADARWGDLFEGKKPGHQKPAEYHLYEW
jgi:hypothetical protein